MSASSSPSERSKRYPREGGNLWWTFVFLGHFSLFSRLFLRLVLHLASLFSLTLRVALLSFMPFHLVVVEYHFFYGPSMFKEKSEFSFCGVWWDVHKKKCAAARKIFFLAFFRAGMRAGVHDVCR